MTGLTPISLAHEEYNVRQNLDDLKIIANEEKLPWSVYVGAAGMPGELYNNWIP